MDNFIKRSVTIYGPRDTVRQGRLSWDEVISEMARLGYTGAELLGQLYFRDCPAVRPEDLKSWDDMMWKYGMKTVAHDFFVDKTMFKGRELTLRESVEVVRRHAEFCQKIGCPIMRIGGTFAPELFRESIPVLEQYGVKMGVELHNGSSTWLLPSIQQTIQIIRDSGSPYIGIIPDMSLFVGRIADSTYFVRGARQQGVDENFIQKMQALYLEVSNDVFRQKCDEMLREHHTDAERQFIVMSRRTENADPRELLEHMPYIIHIHGKFWEIDENLDETSIDYPAILKVLVEGGYANYISAEFEGAPPPDDAPFLPYKRFMQMLDKHIGGYPAFPEPQLKPATEWAGPVSSKGYRNVYDADGTCTGFEIYAKSGYYRGLPLCLVNGVQLAVDGEAVPAEAISLRVDGQTFTLAEAATVEQYYWNFNHAAAIIVNRPGGLDTAKLHTFDYKHEFRTYYLPFNWSDTTVIELDAIK